MKILDQEKGAILPLLAITIVVLIGIIGYSIDTSRSSYTVNTIQEAVDNSSLSASRQLNGEPEGWDNAKSVAIINLQKNAISSVPKEKLEQLVFNIDSTLGDNTVAQVDNLKVTIARGVYWSDSGVKKFISLEKNAEIEEKGPWLHNDFNQHIFANAIKIEVTLADLDSSGFSKAAFNQNSIKNLSRSSISINDSSTDFDASPFAIPYCQFLLNTDSNEEDKHYLDDFNPNKAASREILFMGLDGFGVNLQDSDSSSLPEEDREGLRRYELQVYNPTFMADGSANQCNDETSGGIMSCKNTIMKALIGTYGNNPGTSSVSEVKEFLESGGVQRVELGSHFKPLGGWSDNTTTMDEVTNAMQSFLDQGNSTIESEFVYEENGRKYARTSFPAVRHQQFDSGLNDFMKRPAVYAGFGENLRVTNKISWPINIGQDSYSLGLMLGLFRQPGQQSPLGVPTKAPFVNTMCNNAEESLDSTDYKIRKQSVVIIAPSSDLQTYEDGRAISYCDFDNQFRGQVQDAKVPWEKNEPRVVGRTSINFVGFNFNKLPNAPEYIDSSGTRVADFRTNPVEFDNPTVLVVNDFYTPEISRFESEYSECSESVEAGSPDSEVCDLGQFDHGFFVPEELSDCFDDGPLVDMVNELSVTSSECTERKEVVSVAENSFRQCREDLEEARERRNDCRQLQADDLQLQSCIEAAEQAVEIAQECSRNESAKLNNVTGSLNQCLERLSDEFSSFAITSVQNSIYTLKPRPNTFCLPLPKEQAFDFNSAQSYESLRPLRSGRGCGGVRARIAESQSKTILTSGKTWSAMKPTLVTE